MNEIAKLSSFKKSLAIAETIEEIKLLGDAASAYAALLKKQNVTFDKQNEIGEFRIEIDEKKGEWLERFYPHGTDHTSEKSKVSKRNLAKMPVSKKESATARKLNKTDKKTKDKAKENLKNKKKVLTPEAVASEIKAIEKEKQLEKNKNSYIESHKKEIKEENKPIIFHSDCNLYLNTITDNSIDLLLTDPPYSTDVEDIKKFVETWLPTALDKIKPSGRAFICIGAYPKELNAYLSVLLAQDKFIVDNPLIWTYKNTLGVTPKMKYNLNYQIVLHLYSEHSEPLDTSVTNEMFSVQEINAPDGRLGDRLHQWQKPDELALRLIKHSTKEGDSVLDCFACTGTFLVMASRLGRKASGCDISSENIEIAKQRGCLVS